MRVRLEDVCEKESSKLKQSDVIDQNGLYPVYGASGYLGNINTYQQSNYYVAVVKDGAGIGRTMLLPPKSSIIGTMQYLIPKDNVQPEYLYYVVKAKHLEKYFSGATIPHIYFKDYKNEQFDLVSFEEQRDIIDRLKKIEIIIDNLSKNLLLLDELVKARFVEMFGDPVANDKEWTTLPLEEACKTIVDCPHSTPSYTTENTGFMCIRTSIVKKNKILWDDIEYIPEDEFIKRIQRKKPEIGDVVYTREGAILGIAAIIDRECNVALGQRSMLLSPDANKCLSEFLCVAMNCDSFLYNALKGIAGSASPHINVGDIKSFKMIMPPIELQNQFADFVKQVDKSKFLSNHSLFLL